MSNKNNDSALYFVVGALVVAVAVMGIILLTNDNTIDDIQPAAGIEKAANQVEEKSDNFSFEINENGVKATREQSE